MTGPVPKSAATRQRRNRKASAATLEAHAVAQPALPEGIAWHAQTVATWDVWWASPMRAEWVDADAPDLIALAVLVNEFWQADDAMKRAKLHGEIRMAAREFGLTPMSRRSLQWEVKRVEAIAPVAPVTPTRQRDPRLRAV